MSNSPSDNENRGTEYKFTAEKSGFEDAIHVFCEKVGIWMWQKCAVTRARIDRSMTASPELSNRRETAKAHQMRGEHFTHLHCLQSRSLVLRSRIRHEYILSLESIAFASHSAIDDKDATVNYVCR